MGDNKSEHVPLGRKIKETFKEWCLSSTSHGVPSIARNENYFIKFMWLVCFIVSSAYCCYSIYNSIVGFYQYNANTQIATIFQSPIEFPAVTICNTNPITTQAGVQFTKDVLAKNNITDILSSQMLAIAIPYSRMQESTNIYFLTTVVTANAMQQNATVQKTLGYDKEQAYIGLVFNNGPHPITNLRWYFHFQFGNCFQFNTGFDENNSQIDILSSSKPGLQGGLRLFMFAGAREETAGLSYVSGARIMVHNRNSAPTVTDGVAAATGMTTDLIITKTTTTLLPKPYNDCYEDLTTPDQFDSFFYRKTLENNYTYRQVECLNICVQDYVIKKCNCSDSTVTNLYNTRYCSTVLENACVYRQRLILYSPFMADTLASFYEYCPMECSTESYQISASSTSFPTQMYVQALKNNSLVNSNLALLNKTLTFEDLRENFMWVNIYYDQSVYTSITQSPTQQVVDLMSNIGGTMGLYIGVSFLSFVEIIELLLVILIMATKKKTRIQGAETIPENKHFQIGARPPNNSFK